VAHPHAITRPSAAPKNRINITTHGTLGRKRTAQQSAWEARAQREQKYAPVQRQISVNCDAGFDRERFNRGVQDMVGPLV
jgi:hypothetical protein